MTFKYNLLVNGETLGGSNDEAAFAFILLDFFASNVGKPVYSELKKGTIIKIVGPQSISEIKK